VKGPTPFSTADLQAQEGCESFDRSRGSFCRPWRPFADHRDIYMLLRSFVQATGKV
jgi:hypothetical protein